MTQSESTNHGDAPSKTMTWHSELPTRISPNRSGGTAVTATADNMNMDVDVLQVIPPKPPGPGEATMMSMSGMAFASAQQDFMSMKTAETIRDVDVEKGMVDGEIESSLPVL